MTPRQVIEQDGELTVCPGVDSDGVVRGMVIRRGNLNIGAIRLHEAGYPVFIHGDGDGRTVALREDTLRLCADVIAVFDDLMERANAALQEIDDEQG